MKLENGFYYHYKRDREADVNEYAYEVIGTAFSTESAANVHSNNPEDFEKDEVVVYRPLYKSALVYQADKRFWVRPIKMFLESVHKGDMIVSRFQKITDPLTIKQLEKIRDELYN